MEDIDSSELLKLAIKRSQEIIDHPEASETMKKKARASLSQSQRLLKELQERGAGGSDQIQ
jgi:hypothetical protein